MTWKFTFRLFAWPFRSSSDTWAAVAIYVVSTIILPVLISALMYIQHPKSPNLPTSKQHSLWYGILLSATICFNIASILLVLPVWIGYHLEFPALPPVLQLIAALWPVILAYAITAEKLVNPSEVPITSADLKFLFICLLLGPILGVGFLLLYPGLISPQMGIFVFPVCFCLLALLSIWGKKQYGDAPLPPHIFALIGGIAVIPLYALATKDPFSTGIWVIILLALVAFMMWRRPSPPS